MRYPKLKPRRWKKRPHIWIVSEPASFSLSGKRVNHYFKSENAALEWASQHKRQRHEHGTQSVTSEERNAILFFREQVGDLKLLPEVVRHWRTTAAEAICSTTVAAAVEHFLDWREHQGRWNPSTAEDTRSRLSIFKAAFSDKAIHELTPADLQEFLAVRGALGTQRKYFNKLCPLFRYAKLHRFLAINPLENIQPPTSEYREIQIYKPTDLAAMLKVTEELYPDLMPFLSLMAFGFLRTEELIPRFAGDPVLEWSALDWSDGQIFVPHVVAKKARVLASNERSIPLNPTLIHWLGPYVKKTGRIVELKKAAANWRLRQIQKKAQVIPLANGLRHSCLTYWLAANGEEALGTVARWSGNSAAIAKRHYVATVKRLEGKAWFGLRRETVPV
jgi:integrase